MLEAVLLVGIGAGAALGGFIIGDRMTRAEPYVPAHKRTDEDKQKTKERIDKHFSVINIETEEDHIVKDMDPEQERPLGVPAEDRADRFKYEASVVEPRFELPRCVVCNVLAKRTPNSDGKYYCKKHLPGGLSGV